MKKTFLYLWLLVCTAVLTSCNLFIEDETEDSDELTFENVPVHHGDGYDAPVTVNESGCEVTYQYKSDVRVLDLDVQQRYIVSVEMDNINAFIEIHYSASTPAELLPVPGEILVSTVTDKFPWGCNHRVQYRVDEDGVYKYLAAFATLQDTYEDLRINGTLIQEGTEEYYVNSEQAVELDKDGEPIDKADDVAAARRRIEFDAGNAHVKLESDSMVFTIPFSFSDQIEGYGFHGSISMDKEKNFYKITNQFDFDDFSISDGKFKARLIQTLEDRTCIDITGGYSKSWRLFRIPAVKGKAIVVGPVVLVLFVNLDLNVNLDFSVTTSVTKHKITRTTYTIDFYEFTFDKEEEVIKDEDWKFGDVALTFSISMDFKVILGIGIYGKIISVRIVPTFTAKVEAQKPLFVTNPDGTHTFDITQKLGVTFTFDFSVTLGVFLDLSLKNILGAFKQVGKDEQKRLLKQVEADAKQTSTYYQGLVEDDADAYDPNKKHYVDGKQQQEGKDEVGLSHTFGPWHIAGPFTWSWYPIIKDKSFKVDKQWDKDKKKMTFVGQFTCEGIGFFGALGLSHVPALRISDGSAVITTLFPDEGGAMAKMKRGSTYRFTIPAVNDDKTYTATPCYYPRPISRSQPEAVDKGLPFCFTSPSVSITDVKPIDVTYEYSEMGLFFDSDGNDYEHCYTFDVDTYTAIKGLANVGSWKVNEIKSGESHTFTSGGGDSKRDATFLMHWSFQVLSHTDSKKKLELRFYPLYYVEGTANTGSTYRIDVFSDRTYTLLDDGDNGFGLENVSFARRRTAATDSQGDVVIGRLVSVETTDGRLVWQNDDVAVPRKQPVVAQMAGVAMQ